MECFTHNINTEGETMTFKQISLTIPEHLFAASKEYSEGYGYRNVQEFILELIRNKVIYENSERYRCIEERMKKGIGVKKLSQKDAAVYLKKL